MTEPWWAVGRSLAIDGFDLVVINPFVIEARFSCEAIWYQALNPGQKGCGKESICSVHGELTPFDFLNWHKHLLLFSALSNDRLNIQVDDQPQAPNTTETSWQLE
jgi:hypothetical protein